MEAEASFVPYETTMASVLLACARSEVFAGKEAVHGYVVKRGMADNQFVQNTLMDMYACLGKMDVACRIFAMVDLPDISSPAVSSRAMSMTRSSSSARCSRKKKTASPAWRRTPSR
uniref:Pentatricopeptide repeat-containing protein n=1 Tax=Oryza brachyantha TaxID=4533 RepID=J3MDF2_ORYBR